jgi:hypothetical protein
LGAPGELSRGRVTRRRVLRATSLVRGERRRSFREGRVKGSFILGGFLGDMDLLWGDG